MQSYDSSTDAGSQVVISAVFTLNGESADPTEVVAEVRTPDGSVTTPLVIQDSTGHYHAIVDTAGGMSGVWNYHFEGTGAVEAVTGGSFYVNQLGF